MLYKLACNSLGISVVPVNPDYRAAEIAYLLQDSVADLAIVLERHEQQFMDGVRQSDLSMNVALIAADSTVQLPAARCPAPLSSPVNGATEASLLYTSGTTGKPKGCRLSHEYELMLGYWYATRGGHLNFAEASERLLNPLPLFHVNAGIVSLFAVMLTGNCQIQPERFSPTKWWPMVRDTNATIVHYLGAIVPILMNLPASNEDRKHAIKFGAGGCLEPILHRQFEQRFDFPLIELWGITECCRILTDNHEPRAIGRPQVGLEVRIVDDNDNAVPLGQSGELLVRHSVETPRKWSFLGYLNKPEATEQAWRGGWFHTGDTVARDATGMVYFIDRKKNIIRRSDENIAAAEVEAVIQGHEAVAQVACIAVPDATRDEEVFACIVVQPNHTFDATTAQSIFERCAAQLTYYKAPGWLQFVDALPVTGTQKVLKHKIFAEGIDPTAQASVLDFRKLKRR